MSASVRKPGIYGQHATRSAAEFAWKRSGSRQRGDALRYQASATSELLRMAGKCPTKETTPCYFAFALWRRQALRYWITVNYGGLRMFASKASCSIMRADPGENLCHRKIPAAFAASRTVSKIRSISENLDAKRALGPCQGDVEGMIKRYCKPKPRDFVSLATGETKIGARIASCVRRLGAAFEWAAGQGCRGDRASTGNPARQWFESIPPISVAEKVDRMSATPSKAPPKDRPGAKTSLFAQDSSRDVAGGPCRFFFFFCFFCFIPGARREVPMASRPFD